MPGRCSLLPVSPCRRRPGRRPRRRGRRLSSRSCLVARGAGARPRTPAGRLQPGAGPGSRRHARRAELNHLSSGASEVKRTLLDREPSSRLAAFVVWVPQSRGREDHVPNATSFVADVRARHYWDGGGELGRRYRALLELSEDAWDVLRLRAGRTLGRSPAAPPRLVDAPARVEGGTTGRRALLRRGGVRPADVPALGGGTLTAGADRRAGPARVGPGGGRRRAALGSREASSDPAQTDQRRSRVLDGRPVSRMNQGGDRPRTATNEATPNRP